MYWVSFCWFGFSFWDFSFGTKPCKLSDKPTAFFSLLIRFQDKSFHKSWLFLLLKWFAKRKIQKEKYCKKVGLAANLGYLTQHTRPHHTLSKCPRVFFSLNHPLFIYKVVLVLISLFWYFAYLTAY